jgi:hypothetical protein
MKMTMTKLAMIAVIGFLLPDESAFGQYGGTSGAKFAHDQEAMLAHYRNLHEEIRLQLEELRLLLGDPGVGEPGKRPGVFKLEQLTKLISLKKEELVESKRMISRGESKQKVIRTKIVRIESDLSRSLNQMPNDPVAQALQKLVEIDESASVRMKKKFETGQISSDELSSAERKLAESRLELAKHQWEETADARKALSAASSALEEAVFETEMQATESAELEKEIESLNAERGRIDAFVREESELSQRAAAIEELIATFRIGNTVAQDHLIERLRKMGVKAYEPARPVSKPNDPSSDPGK